MKKGFYILGILLISGLFIGCGKVESVQNVTQLEAGTAVDLSSLITFDEGAECEIVSSDIDFNKIGDYSVTYRLTEKRAKTEVTYDFSVIDTTAPEIVIISGAELYPSEEFNIEDYITCEDNVDGDLVSSVVYDDVDTSQVGDIDLAISVVDSSGNESTDVLPIHIEENDSIYLGARKAIEVVKEMLYYSDSFKLKQMINKNVDENFLYWIYFESLNGYGDMTENEIYVRLDQDYNTIDDYAWDATYNVGKIFLESDADGLTLDNRRLGYEECDIEEINLDSLHPMYTAASNCIKAIKNSLIYPASFQLLSATVKEYEGGYLFWVSFENEAVSDTTTNELYVKTDENNKVILGNGGLWNESYSIGKEYLSSDAKEETVDISKLGY
jgi:hypothetical protein